MVRRTPRVVMAASVLSLAVTGCSVFPRPSTWAYPHSMKATLAESPEDHDARVVRILEHDRRALIEDLDLLFLTDRETRLTRWHDR